MFSAQDWDGGADSSDCPIRFFGPPKKDAADDQNYTLEAIPSATRSGFEAAYAVLADKENATSMQAPQHNVSIRSGFNRDFLVPEVVGGVARFSFEQLCGYVHYRLYTNFMAPFIVTPWSCVLQSAKLYRSFRLSSVVRQLPYNCTSDAGPATATPACAYYFFAVGCE